MGKFDKFTLYSNRYAFFDLGKYWENKKANLGNAKCIKNLLFDIWEKLGKFHHKIYVFGNIWEKKYFVMY